MWQVPLQGYKNKKAVYFCLSLISTSILAVQDMAIGGFALISLLEFCIYFSWRILILINKIVFPFFHLISGKDFCCSMTAFSTDSFRWKKQIIQKQSEAKQILWQYCQDTLLRGEKKYINYVPLYHQVFNLFMYGKQRNITFLPFNRESQPLN